MNINKNDNNNDIKFNLIFIDGKHFVEYAYNDILNMKIFANHSYHRLLIDDCSHPPVAEAVNNAINNNIIKFIEAIETPMELCTIADVINEGIYAGSYLFRNKTIEENCEYLEMMKNAKSDGICIGEYIF